MSYTNNKPRIFLICPDNDTSKLVSEFCERTSKALKAIENSMNALADVDDRKPDWMLKNEVVPILNGLLEEITGIYPYPAVLEVDIETLDSGMRPGIQVKGRG